MRCLFDREPDLVEGAKQPIAGMPNGVGKRARIGTVAAIAVEGAGDPVDHPVNLGIAERLSIPLLLDDVDRAHCCF